MRQQTAKRIVLFKPGINAQMTRRVLGMGRAMGISIEIVSETNSNVDLKSNKETIFLSTENCPDNFSLATDESIGIKSDVPLDGANLKRLSHSLWLSTPLQPESKIFAEATAMIAQYLVNHLNCSNMGWQSIELKATCTKQNLGETIGQTLTRLGLIATPISSEIIKLTNRVKLIAMKGANISLSFSCDGNLLRANWNFRSSSLVPSKLISAIAASKDSANILIINPSEESISLQSQYFLNLGHNSCPSFLMVGMSKQNSLNQNDVDNEWEKTA